jgi:uncharacterized protein (TIGR03083 family)
MTDWADLYRAHVAAVSELYGDLTDEQLELVVPATPAWRVKDVLAHLAGGAADAVTGRMEGAPGPGWTARHVAERTDLPVADLTTELRTNQDAVGASTVDNPRPAIVWDISVHHADLHEALGRGRLPEEMWRPVLTNAAALKLGTAGVPEEIDDYEMFRALFSRRSRTQMQAWGLALSPEQLDEMCIFGPREDAQPVP